MAERARFIREGFCWPALLFGPLWLLARGLWGALGVWCLGAILVALALRFGNFSSGVGGWLYLLSAVLLGLEGRGYVAGAIERRGFTLVDIVAGPDRAVAEQVFFHRWFADKEVFVTPVARAHIPVAPSHVIGMFPEAGG